jgi:hypothetical protein
MCLTSIKNGMNRIVRSSIAGNSVLMANRASPQEGEASNLGLKSLERDADVGNRRPSRTLGVLADGGRIRGIDSEQ